MRELNFDELDVVSGGEDDSEIPVTADRYYIPLYLSLNGEIMGAVVDFSGIAGNDILDSNDWDGDGTINEADDDPFDSENNQITVVADKNPVAAEIANFVQANWASVVSALGAKYGASSPFKSTLSAGVAGTNTAPAVGDLTFRVVDNYMKFVEKNSNFYGASGDVANVYTATQ
jgi:hypothetical protein